MLTTMRGVSLAVSISHLIHSSRVRPASRVKLPLLAAAVQTPAQICRRWPAASSLPLQSIATTRCNPASGILTIIPLLWNFSAGFVVIWNQEESMLKFLLFCILLVICWPIAIAAVLLYPLIWLILLPFRLVGLVVGGTFELIAALFYLPARMIKAI